MNLTGLIIGGAVIVFVLLCIVLALYARSGHSHHPGGGKRTITLADGTKEVGYRYLSAAAFVWPGMEKVYVLPMDVIPSDPTPEVHPRRRPDPGRGVGPGQDRLLR
jgi:hypothetical protein